MLLLVGLGNPNPNNSDNRHNVGFLVIDAINEDVKITKCNGIDYGCSSKSHSGKCLTHNLWEELGNHIYFYLSSISLEDVKNNKLNPISNIINQKTLNLNYVGIND